MTIVKEEILLEGVPICDGIGIGKLFFLQAESDWAIPEFAITSSQVLGEISRYRRALSSSRSELEKLQYFLAKEGSNEALSIIDTHIQMLDDPLMTQVMVEKISLMMQNTESVFHFVIHDYKQSFIEAHKEIAGDRLLDLQDLSKRILKHLNPAVKTSEEKFPKGRIACGYELVPSFAAEASVAEIEGFISEIGGETSHTALIAKSKSIPYVSYIKTHLLEHIHENSIIIDGNEGFVIVNANEDTLKHYQKEKRQSCNTRIPVCDTYCSEETADGRKVSIWANIECMSDLEKVNEYNVSGIGLIRTEFLFLKEKIEELTEETQFLTYKKILEAVGDIPATFRLFDFGSDKKFVQFDFYEPNPALGCRSIRYLLKYPHLLRLQLRALLRASKYGQMKIMLPFISDLEELLEVKRILSSIKEELIKEGVVISKTIHLGCMVEVPAFILMADHFAKECDFFSIGTNDLVQYTLAIDRCNPSIESTYHPAHPSILRLINMTLKAAEKEGIDVSLCGEVASNCLYTPLLVGMGLKILSCSVRYIPYVRTTLKKFDTIQAEKIAKKAIELASFHDVHQLLVDTFSHFQDDM